MHTCECKFCHGTTTEVGECPSLPNISAWGYQDIHEISVFIIAAVLFVLAPIAYTVPPYYTSSYVVFIIMIVVAGFFLELSVWPAEKKWQKWSRANGMQAMWITPAPPWRSKKGTMEVHVVLSRWEDPGKCMVAIHHDYALATNFAKTWGRPFMVSTWHEMPSWWGDFVRENGGTITTGSSPRWLRLAPFLRQSTQIKMFGRVVRRRSIVPKKAWSTTVIPWKA